MSIAVPLRKHSSSIERLDLTQKVTHIITNVKFPSVLLMNKMSNRPRLEWSNPSVLTVVCYRPESSGKINFINQMCVFLCIAQQWTYGTNCLSWIFPSNFLLCQLRATVFQKSIANWIINYGDEEMSHWLRVLAALEEDLGLVFNTYKAAHNHA